MKKAGKRILTAVITLGLAFVIVPCLPGTQQMAVVEAHHGSSHHSGKEGPGSTDCYYYCGGHQAHLHDNGTCPYTDYYCDGHEAHQHTNGVCPFAGSAVTGTADGTVQNDAQATGKLQADDKVSAEEIRQLQQKLSDAGYSCGKADGIWGRKSKSALKCYQSDHHLTEDGCISKDILSTFEIAE